MSRRDLGAAGRAVVAAVRPQLDRAAAAGRPVVIGCSGGADSLALCAGVAWCLASAERTGRAVPGVRVAIIDHGLQSGSAQVAERAADQVRGLGLEPAVIDVEVHTARGVEAGAREARRGIWELLDPAEIWLAHTRDDQAEQVLLGLARGSGTTAIAGMATGPTGRPDVDGRLVRPLLGLTAGQTRGACAEAELDPWADPHNQDPRFLRSRVRTELMPELTRVLGPGTSAALARTAELARRDAEALDALAERELRRASMGAGRRTTLDAAALAELPVAIGSRVVLAWLREIGLPEPIGVQLDAVLDLARRWTGQGPVDMPGGRVERVDGRLRACREATGDVSGTGPAGSG